MMISAGSCEMTLKTGVMMLKIQLYHHRNKLHFKQKSVNNISQYYSSCCIMIK